MKKVAVSEALNKHLSLNQQAKVVVVGLGNTGFSVAKFLHKQGIKFAVIDSRDKPPLKDDLLKAYPDTPVFTGGFDSAAFEVATHVIVSPGVSLQEPSIQKAIIAGAKLVSDIDLFSCATDKSVIAITGSNGKSTVTTMLGAMGDAAGVKTAIGGNLGTPVLDLIDEQYDLYVIELSSFQLERTHGLNAKAATVLNVSADHLDRHDDIMDYAKVKQGVFAGNGVMILNEDDSIVKGMEIRGRDTVTFSIHGENDFHIESRQGENGRIENWLMNAEQPLMRQAEIPLEGPHNIANALAALALGTAAGLNCNAMCNALREFKGLDHRMQKVAELNGVTWVNDSKATNIGACVAALQGYMNKVVLIAGGDAKGANMDELIPVIKDKAKCVVLMGKDAAEIERAINGCVPSYMAETIQDAVHIAAKIAVEGESVLLSPACASIDQYKNYQERGEKFTAAVLELAA